MELIILAIFLPASLTKSWISIEVFRSSLNIGPPSLILNHLFYEATVIQNSHSFKFVLFKTINFSYFPVENVVSKHGKLTFPDVWKQLNCHLEYVQVHEVGGCSGGSIGLVVVNSVLPVGMDFNCNGVPGVKWM